MVSTVPLTCPSCGVEHDGSPTWLRRFGKCRACRSAEMREWRRSKGGYAALTAEEKAKSNARAYANANLRRGKITREPCNRCGAEPAQMHHHDYSKPLEVEWLCRPCHAAHHRKEAYSDDKLAQTVVDLVAVLGVERVSVLSKPMGWRAFSKILRELIAERNRVAKQQQLEKAA